MTEFVSLCPHCHMPLERQEIGGYIYWVCTTGSNCPGYVESLEDFVDTGRMWEVLGAYKVTVPLAMAERRPDGD